ncbi:MAG: hypothetical protein ACPGJV_10575 [Bacteriovoracaceae bacterium]
MLQKKTLSFIGLFTLLGLAASCQQAKQNGANSFMGVFKPKINFAFERYYVRAQKCEITQSHYVKDSSNKLEAVLAKIQDKALKHDANWAVVTGFGEEAVSDHYFFEAYNCDEKKSIKVTQSIHEANQKIKFAKIKNVKDVLTSKSYPEFQSLMRQQFKK